MNYKKGFTLIELLAVIAILAIIMLIATPKIMDAIEESRIAAFKNDEEIIKKAAMLYAVNHTDIVPTNIGEEVKLPLADVINSELITEIKDLEKTSSNCDGYILIRKLADGSFDYKPYILCDKYSSEGIVAWYKLNGNTNDSSGNALNANPTNITYTTDGDFTVASFDGTSEVITPQFYGTSVMPGVSPSATTNYNGDATLSVWVKPSELNGNRVFDDGNSSGEGLIALFSTRIDYAWTNVNNYAVNLNLNEWYYLTLTHKKDDKNNKYIYSLYIDGIFVSSGNIAISTSPTYYGPDGKTRIGSTYKGLMSDVYISNQCWTAEEVLENYNLTKYNRK